MREIPELPTLRASRRLAIKLFGLALCQAVLLVATGCSIKQKVRVQVPPSIQQAKTASYDELLGILKSYDKISDLRSSGLRLTLIYGKRESGELEKYRSAPGYILLRKPDSTHMVLQNPVSKTTVLDLLSVDEDFSAWIPSRNKFYIGKNSAKELVFDDTTIPIRGTHIFEAIFPHDLSLGARGIRTSLNEELNASAKYYVLSVYRDDGAPRIHTIRRIWIERSELTIARQQFFHENGQIDQIASDIEYSDMEQANGFFLPLKIHIDRPLDGYALTLEFKSNSWRVNEGLPDNAFILKPPEGAQIVHPK